MRRSHGGGRANLILIRFERANYPPFTYSCPVPNDLPFHGLVTECALTHMTCQTPVGRREMGSMRVLLGLLGAAVLVYCGVAGLLYGLQRRILFRPDVTAPDLFAARVPGLQAVTLHTRDGLDLLAWWLPPPPASRRSRSSPPPAR